MCSIELFKQYVTPKSSSDSPKKFTDCARLYSECRAPNEHPIGLNKKKKYNKLKNQTTVNDETTTEIDPVTQYVQQRKK